MNRSDALTPDAARKQIRTILETGVVTWTDHALEQLAKRRMTTVDAVNVLRGGAVRPDRLDKHSQGRWTYHVWTPKMTVVMTFVSGRELRVITAWRNTG